MKFVHLSDEQAAHIALMDHWAKRSDANPSLLGDRSYVEEAERLLAHGSELKVPMPGPVRLQLIVSQFRSEEDLPSHLRGDWFKG